MGAGLIEEGSDLRGFGWAHGAGSSAAGMAFQSCAQLRPGDRIFVLTYWPIPGFRLPLRRGPNIGQSGSFQPRAIPLSHQHPLVPAAGGMRAQGSAACSLHHSAFAHASPTFPNLPSFSSPSLLLQCFSIHLSLKPYGSRVRLPYASLLHQIVTACLAGSRKEI